MSAAFVIQAPPAQQLAAQNPSQSFPLGVNDGSLLVLVFCWANTSGSVSGVSDTMGNQWVQIDFQQTAGTLRTMYVFATQNSGDGNCTVTIATDSSRTYSFKLYEIIGASINLDGAPVQTSSSVNGTVVNTGTLTTTVPGSIVIAATKCGAIATSPSKPWSTDGTNNFGTAIQVSSAPGPFSTGWTAASSTWATTILAFQPSPGPGQIIGPMPIISDLPLSTNLLADPKVLSNPQVGMGSYRSTWATIQKHQPAAITNDPNDSSFNWNFFDECMAQATHYGKLVSFHVAVQAFGTPGWVKSNAAQFIDTSGDSVAVYWDSYYQNALIAFIQAMGKRYAYSPSLYKTIWTICSIGGSWNVPHASADWVNSASFNCPAYGASVSVPTTVNSGMSINQYCFIPGFGWFKCNNASPGPGTTQTKLFNPGFSGNASSGTVPANTTIQVRDVDNFHGPAYNYTTAQIVAAQEAILNAAAAAFPNAYVQLQVGTSGNMDIYPGGPTFSYNAATQMAQFAYANLPRFGMDRDGFDPYTPIPQKALASKDKSGWYLLAQPTTGSSNTSGTTGSIPRGGTIFGQANWPAVDPSGQYTPGSTNNYKANHGVPYTDPMPVIAATLYSARMFFCKVIEMYEQDLAVYLPKEQEPVPGIPPGVLTVPPYTGQAQQQIVPVPAQTAYQGWDGEEGPWVMPPYAQIFGYDSQAEAQAQTWVPPPVKQTDIFTAQQTFPL